MGNIIPRPVSDDGEPAENITEHQKRIQPLFDELVKNVPFEKENRTPEQNARWLLANMLDWYRREKKSFWWEVFRLQELTDEELLEEKDALAGFYYNAANGFITNAVKLIPLGQQDGQAILMSLLPLINELANRSLSPDEKMIGFCCAGFDLRCMQHEQLYSRLYMS